MEEKIRKIQAEQNLDAIKQLVQGLLEEKFPSVPPRSGKRVVSYPEYTQRNLKFTGSTTQADSLRLQAEKIAVPRADFSNDPIDVDSLPEAAKPEETLALVVRESSPERPPTPRDPPKNWKEYKQLESKLAKKLLFNIDDIDTDLPKTKRALTF